jgi:ribosomal protein L22
MNIYIQQLLELIDEAQNKATAPIDHHDLETEQYFAEEFLQGRPEMISKVVGINKYHFPSTDKLSDTQISILLEAIEKLLLAYNWEFMFPENVSEILKYQFIIDHWDSKHVFCQKAIVQIETCKFDESQCPFPGHCNVCQSFKDDSDCSHCYSKGQIDFTNLIPDYSEDEDASLRQDIDRVKNLMKEQKCNNYITGIHNYCDGRCSQCPYTERCSSYSLNAEIDNLNQKDEENNEKQLEVILKATSEILEEELVKKGINLEEALSLMDDTKLEQKPKHPLEKQAESYAEKVKRWLESNQIELESRIVAHSNSGIEKDTETITWFQLFIPTKINRVIKGMLNNENCNANHYDAKGSAKIALIAIDECIGAWENILQNIPSKEDSILNLLRHLSKLRNELEDFIPDARAFVRPGFDE